MSSRDKAVELAQHYLVRCCPGATDDSDSNAEVENMIDLIIEAAAGAGANLLVDASVKLLARDLGWQRQKWIERRRGTLSDQIVGQLEQAFEAGWEARGGGEAQKLNESEQVDHGRAGN